MKVRNTDLHRYLSYLDTCKHTNGLLGYAIARNIRLFKSELHEYLVAYEEALRKYGSKEVSDTKNGGAVKLSIDPSSATYQLFIDELQPIADIEIEVDVCRIPISKAIDQLNAEQLVLLDFMLADDDPLAQY